MFYLLLAILSSACISILLRLGEKYIEHRMVMFASNYFVCSVMALLYFDHGFLDGIGIDGFPFAIGLGILSGVFYLVSFVMFQFNIHMNGVVLSSTFMKLGVLVPTIMAILLFGELPSAVQIVGILLAVLAIILIHFEKEEGAKKKTVWLIVLLMCGGFTDSLSNIYDQMGSEKLKDEYLLLTFFVALIFAIMMAIREKSKIRMADVVMGIAIGIPNYFSARFLLLALGEVMAVIAYPVYSTATIVIISLAGMVLFHEKLNRKKRIALGMILVALILLNV